MQIEKKIKNYNAGEWSELYTFAKILCQGHVHFCNKDLEPYKDKLLISGVKRSEGFYSLNETTNNFDLKTSSANYENLISLQELIRTIAEFKNEWELRGKGTTPLESGEKLIKRFKLERVKASSADKKDITLSINDPKTSQKKTVGFSIKSYIGSPSTLLNFGRKTTRFIFRVNGFDDDIEKINGIQTTTKIKDRVQKIMDLGGSLEFEGLANTTFRDNLHKIDSVLPEILSEILLTFVSTSRVSKINELLSLSLDNINKLVSYEATIDIMSYKLKDLLTNVALGMVPSKPWNGIAEADGGYVVVKPSWELVCFYVTKVGELKNYLYENIKLDSPSTRSKKGDYAYLYRDKDQQLKFDLQLQLRFI